MAKVMAALKPKALGRADMAAVSQKIKDKLGALFIILSYVGHHVCPHITYHKATFMAGRIPKPFIAEL